ncbi:hypothetical protein CYLTODRAFT_375032 [Cylindrobasidium torrendii FP15055 ss-10]|uniref:Uncharacterized protein n=1 Tax=Cylindrobasidium torrendii FP15055 ss-10 TaxID=1314674 RepID=A0A0D7BCS5_9AGAR|nr:hypothetical protein CYLTODRAFT_375032 [Cylindrobasidium torrendii FP15055 ss-10]
MKHIALTTLALGVVAALDAQIPLGPTIEAGNTDSEWDLNVLPNPNDTGRFIFDNVASFLQHWPNARYRNGHSLVPAVVPQGTILYHGRGDGTFPSTPEWLATDPEHANIFCLGKVETGCWQLTVAAVRPLNVLYFDGSGAAKMPDGAMDTQDLVAWGEIRPEKYIDEIGRIEDLCKWARKHNVDGLMRMEMDFEIMFCDFHNGLEIVSFLQLHTFDFEPPILPGGPQLMRHVFDGSLHYSHVAGSWHNRAPGDTRFQLDLTRMLTFYDTDLIPSLVVQRAGKHRWQHRLHGISSKDVAIALDRLGGMFDLQPSLHSSVDWTTLFRVLVERYAGRLEHIRDLLLETEYDSSRTNQTAHRVQNVLTSMLRHYAVFDAIPSGEGLAWVTPVFELCARTHTKYISSLELSYSERILLSSFETTNKEICRVVTTMWANGVHAGLDEIIPVSPKATPDALRAVVRGWEESVIRLMAWLDWSVWVRCEPACDLEEFCYMPEWPWLYKGDEDEGVRNRPQPKCIRRYVD